MISPGERRHYLTVEVPKRVSDGMGGTAVTWTAKANVWAAIWPVSSNERIQADKPNLSVSHKIRFPFLKDFKGEWRLRKRSRIFSVVSIINVQEMDEELELLCKEGVK